MNAFFADLAYAGRTFRKKPAFAVTAVATLALAIGATTAIFSVVNAVLLEPLPYQDAGRLVHIWHDLKARNVKEFPWAPADYHDLRQNAEKFEAVAMLVTGRQVVLNENGEAELIRNGGATPNLFRTLGTRVVHGIDFTEQDATPAAAAASRSGRAAGATGASPAAHDPQLRVLAAPLGGDPTVVGTVVSLGEQRFDVIGVLEPGFELLFPPGSPWSGFRIPTPLRVDLRGRLAHQRIRPRCRQAEARRHTDAGAGGRRCARRGSPLALPYQADRRLPPSPGIDARRPRRGRQAVDPRVNGRRDVRAAHRVRERRQPVADSRIGART
jgi:hypothetical protein